MSNYLNQTGKEILSNPVFVAEGIPKVYHNPQVNSSDHIGVSKQVLTTAQPVAAHIGSGLPEPYMSAGGYYTNGPGFAMSFPNFSQPAQWSTGTNNPQAPQNFDHTALQYSAMGAAPSAQANPDVTQNHPYVTADHLFNQSNTNYQNAFSTAPYMNGNWSYFNNQSSFFFPTGTGDLNLTWGAATADNPNGNALFQDLYKPPLPPTEQDKVKVDQSALELSSGFDKCDSNPVDTMDQALSKMHVNSIEREEDNNHENGVPVTVNANIPGNSGSKGTKIASSINSTGQSNAPAKPVSWAAVASQPAKSKPPPKKAPLKEIQPVQSSKPNYSAQNGTVSSRGKQQVTGRWNNRHSQSTSNSSNGEVDAVINDSHLDINRLKDATPLLKKLMDKYNFNPKEFNMDLKNARFFIIKSYSEDDIFRSIKYSSWTSTEHGNRKLNDAFKEQQKTGLKTPMYLLFSVNSSGHFCGVAEMKSEVDLNVETGIWVQDKWKGRFDVKWIYVKDVPNNILRHIRLENNENKPVTNSRDTQEVRPDKGTQVLKIMHNYKAQTSIFDDFAHYEKRQEEDAKMRSKMMPEPAL